MIKSYSIIVSSLRLVPGDVKFWDIIDKRTFHYPSALQKYAKENAFYFRKNLSDLIKIEMYEVSKNGLDLTQKPYIIKQAIAPCKKHFNPCVYYPNNNIQELKEFIAHWRQYFFYRKAC